MKQTGKKILSILLVLFLLVIAGLSFWIFRNIKDRHSGYNADVSIINRSPSPLMAGFAALTVTPEVPDRWNDKNGDFKYQPEDGEPFSDGNGNGVFDPVWIAGFSNKKPANGIHDDIWARTVVLGDGKKIGRASCRERVCVGV